MMKYEDDGNVFKVLHEHNLLVASLDYILFISFLCYATAQYASMKGINEIILFQQNTPICNKRFYSKTPKMQLFVRLQTYEKSQ